MYLSGLIGEKSPIDSGETVVIKDHIMHSSDYTSQYTGAILLIRNPYDAIVAEYNRFRTLSHVGSVGNELLKSRGKIYAN